MAGLPCLSGEGALGGKAKLGAVLFIQAPVHFFLLAVCGKSQPRPAVFDLLPQDFQN